MNIAPLVVVLMKRLNVERAEITEAELVGVQDKLLTIRGDGEKLHLNLHDGAHVFVEGPERVQ